MPSHTRPATDASDRRISRRLLAATLALAWALGGCGGGSNAPFFKNAFADKPVIQSVPMVHGFTVLLVDEEPSREESTFSLRFKAGEPLDFTLADGQYQDDLLPPTIEINGSPVEMDKRLNSTAAEARISVKARKVAGKETKSSHQIRLEVFANGALDSTAVTPVELEIAGPPGARWDVSLHQGPAPKGPAPAGSK